MDRAVKIGMDEDQAMKAMANNWPLDPGNPDYDLLQHVRGQITALPLTITFRWIASHQDKHKALSQLDRWEQLNVECYGLAKSYWNTCALACLWPGSLQFGHEKWSLWIEEKKLSTVEKARVYEYTYALLTKAYWQKKHNLTPRLIKSINWEACGDAMGQLPFGKNAGFYNTQPASVARDGEDFYTETKPTPNILPAATCRLDTTDDADEPPRRNLRHQRHIEL